MKEDVIISYLKDFDRTSRDNNYNIIEGNGLDQLIKNIIDNDNLDASNYDNYLRYDLEINNGFYNNINKKLFIFNEGINLPDRKVSSFFLKADVKKWNSKNNVFILAGTGKGKNFFVKHFLASKKKKKTVLFVNRQSLLNQQKKIIREALNEKLDYVISSFENEGIVKINEQFMLVSYQKAAHLLINNQKDFRKYLFNVKYAVFDEIHYLLDDANFNKNVNVIRDELLINDNKHFKPLSNATKIFMSATMEEMLVIFHEMGYKFKGNDYFVIKNSPNMNNIAREKIKEPKNYYLNLPTDYSYINPRMYTELNLLVDEIVKSNDKWMIFVDSKNDGEDLRKVINEKVGENVAVFLNANNKTVKEFNDIVDNERFDCRILIATTVLYNGINIKDETLKNIVLPFTTVPMAKQMIGRKRIEDKQTLNVYFYDVQYDDIENKFKSKINDYFDAMKIDRLDISGATATLNGMLHINSNYYYVEESNNKLIFKLNEMAFYKLHFDTMFLLYVLKKMTKEHSSYVMLMLEHLGIEDKYNEMIINSPCNEETKKELAVRKLEKLLRDYEGTTEDKYENGKYSKIPRFNIMLNEIYKELKGVNIDSHYNDKSRLISAEKINKFIDLLELPYEVKISSKNSTTQKREMRVIRKL